MKYHSLTGKKFGRWEVFESKSFPRKTASPLRKWRCVCECGTEKYIRTNLLVQGKSTSCGCAKPEKTSKQKRMYPKELQREVETWRSMKDRCLCKTHHAYHRYGGRGITIHPEWIDDFWSFFKEIGKRPSDNHSLDRIDNNKGYIPGNIRWATRVEQTRNCSRNVDTPCIYPHRKKFKLMVQGKYYGLYNTIEEAEAVRDSIQ